jgi:hypothetical protein
LNTGPGCSILRARGWAGLKRKIISKKPEPIGKARAAALQGEIDKLTGATQAGENEKKTPDSPRDFINRWMAEHDKKPEEK